MSFEFSRTEKSVKILDSSPKSTVKFVWFYTLDYSQFISGQPSYVSNIRNNTDAIFAE
jgi:hypothetical protein